jgi:hypothetical protein
MQWFHLLNSSWFWLKNLFYTVPGGLDGWFVAHYAALHLKIFDFREKI